MEWPAGEEFRSREFVYFPHFDDMQRDYAVLTQVCEFPNEARGGAGWALQFHNGHNATKAFAMIKEYRR